MAQSVSFDAVYQYINSVAPFETQAGFDNSGFLVGKRGDIAQGVLFALDVTDAVLDEAERLGANLIVTHHPLMFSPIHALLEDDYEGRLIMRMVRNRMGLIAAHTNLDSAPGGINDTLCSVLGLTNVSGEGYFRVGDLPQKRTFGSLVENIETCLHTVVRVFGQMAKDTPVRRVGVSSGAGSEFWEDARDAGAQVFLTGEMKHHHGLAMAGFGMAGLEAGHFATEEPGIFALADALQRYADEVEWNVAILKSSVGAYALRAESPSGM